MERLHIYSGMLIWLLPRNESLFTPYGSCTLATCKEQTYCLNCYSHFAGILRRLITTYSELRVSLICRWPIYDLLQLTHTHVQGSIYWGKIPPNSPALLPNVLPVKV